MGKTRRIDALAKNLPKFRPDSANSLGLEFSHKEQATDPQLSKPFGG